MCGLCEVPCEHLTDDGEAVIRAPTRHRRPAALRPSAHLRAEAGRQPAVAFYLWRKREDAYLPLTIDVLRITGGAITEIVTFHDDQFPRLGLPERLPAEGTE
jgi:RNA polymerase sigma-70 factor, ECF subfamily